MVKRPIDSFVQYFLDIKPYHTKILDIVERYLIKDDINVSFNETTSFTEIFQNRPLCNQIGYGLDFDDDCGYSSLFCCDLFQCVGGYGLIYDNSDLLVNLNVVSFDNERSTITVSGDRRFDTYININSAPDEYTIKVKGNQTSLLANHGLFLIEPVNCYDIVETTYNGFYVYGDVEKQFAAIREFVVFNSGVNDNNYTTIEVKYSPLENKTFIKTFIPRLSAEGAENYSSGTLDVTALGNILIKTQSKNQGAYIKDSVYFDGADTVIRLSEETKLKMLDSSNYGSIVLRTGFKPQRRIHLNIVEGERQRKEDFIIQDALYDVVNNTTILTLGIAKTYDKNSQTCSTWLDLSLATNAELYGYFFGSGFDGYEECSVPKEYNIHAGIEEFLYIEEIIYQTTPPEVNNWVGDVDVLITT